MNQSSTAEDRKLFFAVWLYRWGLSMGIIGTVFTVLTFVGVYFQLLGPTLIQAGVPSWATGLLFVGATLIAVLGFGLYLDKHIQFWSAQATAGTVRNQYLVDTLYQKELLSSKYNQIPQLKTFRLLVEKLVPAGDDKDRMLSELDQGIVKIAEAVRNKRWDIEEDERVY